MKMDTIRLLHFFHVLAWIFFIAMCFEAGSYMFNMIFTLGFRPLAADYFKLTDLYTFNKDYFALLLTVMTLVAVLKTLTLYRIVKIFTDRKLDLKMPFSNEFADFIFALSHFTLAIGLSSIMGMKVVEWISDQNIFVPDAQYLRMSGADVWLFMSAVLYVIAQIFKRGVEMQAENELTI
ncbi:MAG: DUF2975 domain-containing protein [Flavobacterium sp.]|nr:MAG: DUF2975 domain-containing protein [Flavobacterium sp.]